jgi:hypothetical protein
MSASCSYEYIAADEKKLGVWYENTVRTGFISPYYGAVDRILYSGDNGLAVRYCDARPESIAFVSSILESEFLVVSYRNSCVAVLK